MVLSLWPIRIIAGCAKNGLQRTWQVTGIYALLCIPSKCPIAFTDARLYLLTSLTSSAGKEIIIK